MEAHIVQNKFMVGVMRSGFQKKRLLYRGTGAFFVVLGVI